jgi:molecular chaperone GrpE (heat shock protein)
MENNQLIAARSGVLRVGWCNLCSMFNVGDYVRHSRQGPGRVVEVLPDQILVRQRSGNMLRVNLGIAQHELELCPPDGFVAQLVHRDYSVEALQTHIEDVLCRILRDKRRRSISIAELKDTIMPFLDREGRKWDSWWKSARKHLHSKTISINTKRKLIERINHNEPVSVVYEIAGPAELLSAVRELRSQESRDRVMQEARVATGRALELSKMEIGDERQRAELVLASCYLYELTKSEQADHLRLWLSKQDLAHLSIYRDLDGDVVVCLPMFAKAVPGQSATILKLLSHPTETVVQKAFSTLNVERHRSVLRDSFFRWLKDQGSSPLAGLDLYLQPEFLRHIRRDDIVALYEKILGFASPSMAVRQFLGREDVVSALLASSPLNQGLLAKALKSEVVSAEAKGRIARESTERAGVLEQLVSDGGTSDASAVLSYLPNISAVELISKWSSLFAFLRQSGSESTVSALGMRLAELLDSSSPELQHHLLAVGSDVWNLAAERGQDLPFLRRSVQRLIGQLSSTEVQEPRSLIGIVTAATVRERLLSMQDLIGSSKKENTRLTDDLSKAEGEVSRLQKLVEMLKSSGSSESEELKIIGKREVLAPILMLCDDLERRMTGRDPDKLAALFADLQSALARAGVRRIGNAGETTEFNPATHEITEGGVESGATVSIIRPGYTIDSLSSPVLLRRALVKLISR